MSAQDNDEYTNGSVDKQDARQQGSDHKIGKKQDFKTGITQITIPASCCIPRGVHLEVDSSEKDANDPRQGNDNVTSLTRQQLLGAEGHDDRDRLGHGHPT